MNGHKASHSEVTHEDVLKVTNLFKGISNQVSTVTDFVQSILRRVQNGEVKTNKGISFLDVKYHLLLSYLIDVTYLMLRKTEGRQLEGDKAIERLVETRTVLEKMRPVDQKIRYQVDKLIKTATVGEIAPNDPRRFKPNPDNLVSKLEVDDSGSDREDNNEKDSAPQKYVPPKVAAMHFTGDLTAQEQKERLLDKAKKRALSSSLIKELREQYDERPVEIVEHGTAVARKMHEAAKHQQDFEESNFIRIPVTRKEKKLKRKRETMTGMEGLTKFDNISVLTGNMGGDEGLTPASKKSKLSSRLRKSNSKKMAKRRKKFKKS